MGLIEREHGAAEEGWLRVLKSESREPLLREVGQALPPAAVLTPLSKGAGKSVLCAQSLPAAQRD